MQFENTGLPRHPTIEKAFADLVALDAGDKFTTRGVLIARLIAEDSCDKDPDAIAAGLFVPYTIESGPLSFAHVELPARASAMIQAMFAIGALAMRQEPVESFYRSQDAATRSVILASSARMFDAAAEDMDNSIATARRAGLQADAEYLRKALEPLSAFTAMADRAETTERSLVAKCQAAIARIEDTLKDPAIPAPQPAGKDVLKNAGPAR